MSENLLKNLMNRFLARWIPCRLISDKQSVLYGLYFSYPIYIAIVVIGIFLQNTYVLLIAALIAFLSIKLPMHLFDYGYNEFAKLVRFKTIPGRGSELQVNSIISLVFNLIVFTLVIFSVSINYTLLAIIYAVCSVYFIVIFWFKD